MYDADQRRWERTLDAAQDIQRAEPPQRVLSSLLSEFETSTPADLPAYAVGELIMALLTASKAETRSHLKSLCDDDSEMPRRRAIDEARSPAIAPRHAGMTPEGSRLHASNHTDKGGTYGDGNG